MRVQHLVGAIVLVCASCGDNRGSSNGTIVASVVGQAITTEQGGMAQISVHLAVKPSANVAVSVTSSKPGEGKPTIEALTFTPENYDAPQTVTVKGVDDNVIDGSQSYEIKFGPALGAPYDGASTAVSLMNIDDETAEILMTPARGFVTEEGGQTEFAVVLASKPTANVTLTVVSRDPGEGTLSPTTLVLTPDNWNAPQVVTITGVDDNLQDGRQAFEVAISSVVSDDPNYNNALLPLPISVDNIDNDTAGFIVTQPAGAVTESGGQATVSVRLTTQPTADVTVHYSSSDTGEGTVSPAQLTFTAANWNAPQDILITGVDDSVKDGNQAFQIAFAATTSADPSYAALQPNNVNVTTLDDETAGVIVTAIDIVTGEDGAQATLTVQLQSQPTADVMIAYSSSNPSEGVASGTLHFTPANWNAPQTITVTGQDDAVQDGNQLYHIDFGPAVSTDLDYAGMATASVVMTNIDDDTAGVAVSPISQDTSEAGGQATFTVVLNSQPTADVTVTLQSDDTSEGTVAPTSLLFTAANWNAPQTVVVTGQNDDVADGNQPYQIDFVAVTSTDLAYNGLVPPNVDVVNTDNDTAGITVSAVSQNTSETGAQATFTVVLNSQPTATVTIALVSDDPSEGAIAPGALVFTPGDWNAPQTVTVTGQNDDVADGNQPFQVDFTAVTSADPAYNGQLPANVDVINTDDDSAGIAVTLLTSPTTEGGGQATFSVVLTSEPTAAVTLAFNTDDASEGIPDVVSVTFDVAHWNAPQIVTITGVDDAVDDGDQPYNIVFSAATSADANYNGIMPANVALTNSDDDTANIIVGPASGNTTEAGGTATFTVRLASQPTGDVTIDLNSNDTSEGTVNPLQLTFNAGNWSMPQTVTVTGQDDAIADGDIAYQIAFTAVTSTDPNYNGQIPTSVALVNVNDDPVTACGVNLLKNAESGGTARVVEYTQANGYSAYRSSLGTTCSEAWFALGTLCDQPADTDSQVNSTKSDNNSGATWSTQSNSPGRGILVIDIGAAVDFDKLQAYQMFSDGKMTHVRFAIHPATASTPPPATDAGWVPLSPGFETVGPGAVAGNTVSQPTNYYYGPQRTRYLRVEARNDGSFGFGNWLEIRSIKMFNLSCQRSCPAVLSANPAAPSGIYTVAPPGVPAFDVFCDMSDGGGWTKIVQYTGGSYAITTNAVGAIAATTNGGDAKLSDAQINALRALSGGTVTYRIKGSLSTSSAYVQSNGTYVDTAPGFGFGNSSTNTVRACVATSFASCSLQNAAALTWLDLLHQGISGGGETCNRYFTGHASGASNAHCWSPMSTTERCVSGGASCNPAPYPAHPSAEIFMRP